MLSTAIGVIDEPLMSLRLVVGVVVDVVTSVDPVVLGSLMTATVLVLPTLVVVALVVAWVVAVLVDHSSCSFVVVIPHVEEYGAMTGMLLW